ncbi:septum formation initiator family protein [Patescibacteria group bacterium]
MKKKTLYGIALALCSFAIIGLSRNLFKLLQAEKRVGQAQEELELIKKEQGELQKKKAYIESEDFVEQQARDKLSMVKKGETLVILPTGVLSNNYSVESEGKRELANWEKWLLVFGWRKD